MKTLLYSHGAFREHTVPAGHPERPERLDRIEEALRNLPAGCARTVSDRVARMDELLRVHAPGYLQALLALRGRQAALDRETHVAPGSVDAALHAAGTCLDMIDALLDGRAEAAFALVRPPGHHALPDRGMGYCLLNNAALAVAHARARGVRRVAVLDIDVHHGNGTQAAFYDDPHVLVIDLHQEALFPAESGGIAEAGTGAGAGCTVNVPLPSGSNDADYLAAIFGLVEPLLARYDPELLLVSCGFDAAGGDPEGGMDLTPDGFFGVMSAVAAMAARHARGRLGLVLEGGYALATLGACAQRTVEALAAAPTDVTPFRERAAQAPPPVMRRIDEVRRRIEAIPPSVP